MTFTYGECGHPLRNRVVREVKSPRRRRRERIAVEIVRMKPRCQICQHLDENGHFDEMFAYGLDDRALAVDPFNMSKLHTRRSALEAWREHKGRANRYHCDLPEGLYLVDTEKDAVTVESRRREVSARPPPRMSSMTAAPLLDSAETPLLVAVRYVLGDLWSDLFPEGGGCEYHVAADRYVGHTMEPLRYDPVSGEPYAEYMNPLPTPLMRQGEHLFTPTRPGTFYVTASDGTAFVVNVDADLRITSLQGISP